MLEAVQAGQHERFTTLLKSGGGIQPRSSKAVELVLEIPLASL